MGYVYIYIYNIYVYITYITYIYIYNIYIYNIYIYIYVNGYTWFVAGKIIELDGG